MADEVITGSLGNSVDELNRKYREEAEKAKSQPEPEAAPAEPEDEDDE